jgi:hypothetical protein
MNSQFDDYFDSKSHLYQTGKPAARFTDLALFTLMMEAVGTSETLINIY